MKTHNVVVAFALLASADSGLAQVDWESLPLFSEKPLEVKLGVFDQSTRPNGLGMVLWNDGVNNRLDAITIPPPYNGSGVTTRGLVTSSTLFALGDICTQGSNVVVPYIKDFNVETLRYDGANWSSSTIPGTQNNNYDSADCVVTNAGIVVAGHDLTDSETELFRSVNGGEDYTFYTRYSGVSGPFDGAVREPLAVSGNGRYMMSLHQQPSGQVRATRVDTAQNPPSVTHTNVTQTAAPSGSFQFVKESAARYHDDRIFFTYNADGTARLAIVPVNDLTAIVTEVLSAIAAAGSQYPFFGGGLLPLPDDTGTSSLYLFWATLTLFGDALSPPGVAEPEYPLTDVGGPVDACLLENKRGDKRAVFLGSRVDSTGTDLHSRAVGTSPIFADDFESGDSFAWTFCD